MENKERKRRAAILLFSLAWNIGLMFLLFRMFDPVFEGNDDITIVQFVNGASGSYDPHLVYQNYLMGLVLSRLYQWMPGMPWYSWFQFWALCLSFSGITYVLGCRIRKGAGLALALLVESFAAYEFYINLQYTKTAGVLAAAGMMLIWHGLWGYREQNRGAGETRGPGAVQAGPLLAGILLAVWSILYRYVQFAACAALTAPIPLLMLLDAAAAGKKCTGLPEERGAAGEKEPGVPEGPAAIPDQTAKGPAAAAVADSCDKTGAAGAESREKTGAAVADSREGIGAIGAESRDRKGAGQGTVTAARVFARCAAVCVLLGILLAGLVLFDRAMYDRDPVWKNFAAYNNARSELMDYGMTKYDDFEGVYTQLGISRTAYDLFDTWNSGDIDVFSTEAMETLSSVRPVKKPGLETVREFIRKVPAGFLKNRIFRCFLAAAALWLLFGRHDRRAVLVLAAGTLLFTGLYYYLLLQGRYLYNRVDTGLWMSALMVLLWTWKEKHGGISRNAVRTVLILAVMTGCALWQIPGWKGKLASHSAESRSNRSAAREQIMELARDTDHLYVSKLGVLSAARCCGPFEPMPQGMLNNVVHLGGWKVESAPYRAALESHGFPSGNPYEAIAGTSDHARQVYLLDNDLESTLAYLREYYNPDAEAVVTGEWNGNEIVQIITGN